MLDSMGALPRTDRLAERLEEELERLPAEAAVALEPLDGTPGWVHRPDEVFPAASVVKIPILLELFRRFQDGGEDPGTRVTLHARDQVLGAGILFELHPGIRLTLRELARLMIVLSDNTASNLLLDRLGWASVNELLARLGARNTVICRKFMYPPGPAGENLTSAADCVRILRALWEGEVLQGTWREEALDILSRQQYREKIPARLPPSARVYNKTGELEGVRHDVGLVEDRGKVWALAVLTRKGRDPWEVDTRIARISRWCYDQIVEGGIEPS
jgi:beta-lactamase class A